MQDRTEAEQRCWGEGWKKGIDEGQQMTANLIISIIAKGVVLQQDEEVVLEGIIDALHEYVPDALGISDQDFHILASKGSE